MEVAVDGNWEQQRRTGRFEIEHYSLDDTNAWLGLVSLPPMGPNETFVEYRARIDSSVDVSEELRPFEQKSSEELRRLAEDAAVAGDNATLQLIMSEARVRDRWEETDPSYAHLIEDCRVVINSRSQSDE